MRIILGPAIMVGVCSSFLFQCDIMTAGTSVGTGNPTEIRVGFVDSSGPSAFTGSVDVFAATQIPAPGFRPQPLAHFKVDRSKEFVLKAENLAAIPDSLWPKSSRDGDSLLRFNLVVAGKQTGAILRGFRYRTKLKDFSLVGVDSSRVDKERKAVKASLVPLVDAEARMEPRLLDPKFYNHLFIYGTGFSVEADSARFRFRKIPSGVHDLAFIAVPKNPAGGNDSIPVFGFKSPLNSDKPDSISLAGILEQVSNPR